MFILNELIRPRQYLQPSDKTYNTSNSIKGIVLIDYIGTPHVRISIYNLSMCYKY